MICELQIKLCSGNKMTFLYHSAHLIYEIERVCDSMDRYKLIEVYTSALNYLTKHNMTIDTNLTKEKRGSVLDIYAKETNNREILTEYLPLIKKFLMSKDEVSFYQYFDELEKEFTNDHQVALLQEIEIVENVKKAA